MTGEEGRGTRDERREGSDPAFTYRRMRMSAALVVSLVVFPTLRAWEKSSFRGLGVLSLRTCGGVSTHTCRGPRALLESTDGRSRIRLSTGIASRPSISTRQHRRQLALSMRSILPLILPSSTNRSTLRSICLPSVPNAFAITPICTELNGVT